MEPTKNLCAQIPESLHARVREEQEHLGQTLGAYVAQILTEHFEQREKGGKAMSGNTRTLAFQVSEDLFGRLKAFADERGIPCLMDGTNEDDLHVYRPGLQAVRELGIISPLADAGFTKKEVRQLAAELGVSVADRPSTPCLATRLPYGAEIKAEVLEQIEKGEEFLKKEGFFQVRLRLHGEIARIEIPQKDFSEFLDKRERIAEQLKKLGFSYITLDIQGFRSGSMDENIKKS